MTGYCPLLSPPGIMSYPAAPTLAALNIIGALLYPAMDMTPRPLWPLPRWAVGHPHFDSQHIGAPLAPFPIVPQWHLILLPGSNTYAASLADIDTLGAPLATLPCCPMVATTPWPLWPLHLGPLLPHTLHSDARIMSGTSPYCCPTCRHTHTLGAPRLPPPPQW